MQVHSAAVPFPSGPRVANPPGMTPTPAHALVARPRAAPGAETCEKSVAVGAISSRPQTVQPRILELLEDAVLLLLIVFAVPAIIILLALPFALIFRITAEIGRRW